MMAAPTDAISVKALTVLTGRLICDVTLGEGVPHYATPALADALTKVFPDLPHHACVNSVGSRFGDVMGRTSLPHILEHLMISYQVREEGAGPGEFVGTTEWTDEVAGVARVQVSFDDDLVALRALDEALRFLNDAVLTYQL